MSTRILIVDDSGISRKVTRKCLEFAGFTQAEYLEAADGERALAILEKGGVQLLVTDLNMPVMDGFELLRAIKESSACGSPLIVVASSAASEAIADELDALGVTAILAKPLTPTVVAKALAGKLPSGGRP